MDDRTIIGIRIPKEVKKRLEEISDEILVNHSEMLRNMVFSFIDQYNQSKKKKRI